MKNNQLNKNLILVLLLLLSISYGCIKEPNWTEEQCNEAYPAEKCPEIKDWTKEQCNEAYGFEECLDWTEEQCRERFPCSTCPEVKDWTKEQCTDKYPPALCPDWTKEQCDEYYSVEKKQVTLGIDNIDDYLDVFKDKKVGLITNPTGINSNYISSIDVLYEKVNLVALFAPEHGIRGNSQAGGSIGSEIDVKTGLNVYSLYGNTKKPTKEMMDKIDVLCIDIQDVGARFYTYIYTMAYAMQACKEYNKEFVVFDRPNPISGNVVDGNILEEEFSSFVGLYPIITRHGMTMGELALLFNEEYSINCNLQIVKLSNYDRTKYFDEMNLPWVNPSPNMPTFNTALVYTGTCLFEGLNLSEGRGTTKPFEFIGAPFINPIDWADKLNNYNLPGVVFRPIYFTPTFEDFANQLCGGVQIHVIDRNTFSSVKTGYAMIYSVKELYPADAKFLSYLKTLTGVDYVYNQKYTLEQLYSKVDDDVVKFNEIRNKYLLY